MMNFSRRFVEFTEELLLASWVAKNAARKRGKPKSRKQRAESRKPNLACITMQSDDLAS